jgi:Arc/MetJ-type ribon-helix-helix transcriptional regulator
MTDLRTAAQKALEFAADIVRGKYKGNAEEIRDALRAALAQQKQCADESDCTHMPWCRVRKTCQRAALAQQEQEPLSVEALGRALVASRVIDPAAIDDPDGYDGGLMLDRVRAAYRRLV